MHQAGFEHEVLAEFRRLYFPAIAQGLTTGYNLYQQRNKQQCPYIVNYLHSDLGVLPNGKLHPHREELIDKLAKFGPAHVTESITDAILDRIAVYKIGRWKSNPQGLTFFTPKGQTISLKELGKYKGPLIVEGKQYDLGIEAITKSDLEKVIRVLNKYTYAKRLGRTGKILNRPNTAAITGAWEIPLITITTHHKMQTRTFIRVSEVSIQSTGYESRSLITQPRQLARYLRAQGTEPKIRKKLVSKPFVAAYLDAET